MPYLGGYSLVPTDSKNEMRLEATRPIPLLKPGYSVIDAALGRYICVKQQPSPGTGENSYWYLK